jgi:hypothetical protein
MDIVFGSVAVPSHFQHLGFVDEILMPAEDSLVNHVCDMSTHRHGELTWIFSKKKQSLIVQDQTNGKNLSVLSIYAPVNDSKFKTGNGMNTLTGRNIDGVDKQVSCRFKGKS